MSSVTLTIIDDFKRKTELYVRIVEALESTKIVNNYDEIKKLADAIIRRITM